MINVEDGAATSGGLHLTAQKCLQQIGYLEGQMKTSSTLWPSCGKSTVSSAARPATPPPTRRRDGPWAARLDWLRPFVKVRELYT
jgi:hypothetical protein